uniref:Uncharacterized protein n=1 Tax=Anopheles atroparvus TaxID=41427 RepID=A0A182JHJ9_ANOAO
MQLVNRGHRNGSSTVSAADGGPADIALMRWPSHGFTAIPVEPDDSVSTASSSADGGGSLEGTTRRVSTPAAPVTEYRPEFDPASCWQRTTPSATGQHQHQQQQQQQRHGSKSSQSAIASPLPPLTAASSTSCLRECLLCRCCRSAKMDDQKETSDPEEGNYESLRHLRIPLVAMHALQA